MRLFALGVQPRFGAMGLRRLLLAIASWICTTSALVVSSPQQNFQAQVQHSGALFAARSQPMLNRRSSGDIPGCCYRIGGIPANLPPCCLETTEETSSAECFNHDAETGAEVGWNSTCPESAEQAASWLEAAGENGYLSIDAWHLLRRS
mmetsp:Transcript_88026/g.139035  ORF Transcript_88026/g.139035 Transcript_88026/m.139035 type:complete len:149 (+) Transcript_88026:77-523(+)